MQLSITTSTKPVEEEPADLLIIPIFQGGFPSGALPQKTEKDVRARMKALSFSGEWGASELFSAQAMKGYSAIALIGMGKKEEPLYVRMEGIRRGVGAVCLEARKRLLRTVSFALPAGSDAADIARAAAEAFELSNYRFTDYQKKASEEQEKRSLVRVTLLIAAKQEKDIKRVVREARFVMAGVSLTRNLVNQPASHMVPKTLAQEARKIARASAGVTVKVFNKKQVEKMGLHAFLAVAKGSKEEPYFIHMAYKPKKKVKKKIAIVGKGITFDSGGLSLKPARYMEDMKIDMAGAATLLGLFSTLSALAIPIEVHGIIAACENMPSGEAYRPGDVLTAKNGKTIEVLNTDAEGRITLADALSYIVEKKPDAVIDLATLTGACIVAVGGTHAGLWSNNDALLEGLMAASKKSGEGLVAFPLPEEYRQTIKSQVADLRNTATVAGGDAITAAMFLQEFVGDTVWAHLDIAAPVYAEKALLPYYAYGGTGFGVRTLVQFLRQQG